MGASLFDQALGRSGRQAQRHVTLVQVQPCAITEAHFERVWRRKVPEQVAIVTLRVLRFGLVFERDEVPKRGCLPRTRRVATDFRVIGIEYIAEHEGEGAPIEKDVVKGPDADKLV